MRGMDGLNEADLVEIKQALEKGLLIEALSAMERTLERLGYKRVGRVSQFDIYLSDTEDIPQLNARASLQL